MYSDDSEPSAVTLFLMDFTKDTEQNRAHSFNRS